MRGGTVHSPLGYLVAGMRHIRVMRKDPTFQCEDPLPPHSEDQRRTNRTIAIDIFARATKCHQELLERQSIEATRHYKPVEPSYRSTYEEREGSGRIRQDIEDKRGADDAKGTRGRSEGFEHEL